MSGHLFDNTRSITFQEWSEIKDELFKFITSVGVNEIVPVGSLMYAKPDACLGDIDLAISYPKSKLELLNDIERRFEVRKVGNDIVSFRYPLSSSEGVQVDLMLGNIRFVSWARAGSPDVGIKSCVRAILLNVIMNWFSIIHKRSEFQGHERVRYALDYGRGLVELKQTLMEKGKWKTIERKFITDDPDEIVKMFFGPNATADETHSVLSIVFLVRNSAHLYCDYDFVQDTILPDFLGEFQRAYPRLKRDAELIKSILCA